MQYTITLADGRKLTGLGKNGDNFVSAKKVDETIFKDNLSIMTVSDGETETVYHNVELIQQQKWADGSWYLAFREQTAQEQAMAALNKAVSDNANSMTDLQMDCTCGSVRNDVRRCVRWQRCMLL